MNIKHTGLLLATLVILSITSCVGIDAEARVDADGSVELTLRYEVSIAVDQIGKLGANEKYLPLAVGQDDMLLAVSRAGGELLSWNRNDETDRFIIDARIRFPDIQTFAAFLDPAGQAVNFSEAEGQKSLTMQLSAGRPPAEEELARFIGTVFADYRTSIRFVLPGPPTTATNLQLEGSTASFSMLSSELYSSSTPVLLVLEW
ncbi:MAG: hypothetical protein AB7T74_00715 [Clostridia bacterium]|jgi:hypothetical protein|nr:hypothetical protein [Spirochaetia bacterium]